MNEIKKCPFCRGDAELTIEVETDCVNATIRCSYCDIIFRFIVPLSEYKTINEAVDDILTMALERWNKRAEEPQERKETNIEWAIKKGLFDLDVCKLAHLTKWGTPCKGECDRCEFKDDRCAINYLLAPHED